MRSGLNLAALQCQFEPLLRTPENYNTMLSDHNAELAAAYATLGAYFKRTSKSVKAGQDALDRFGTRTISGFSSVRGQLGFCETAGRVGRAALFVPRGGFTDFSMKRLREMRNALKPAGEQQFNAYVPRSALRIPSFEPQCWDKKGRYNGKCGWQ
jgi:hypothetical protein